MSKKYLLFLFLIVCFAQNNEMQLQKKIDNLISNMTLEEKISLLHGSTNFTIPGVKRLGIDGLTMSDGPHGVREDLDEKSWKPNGSTKDSATYLPNLTSLAATWNVDLAKLFGETLGREAKARKKDVMLGPGINIHRTPLGGRNFEYMSEDQVLVSKITVPLIKAIQSNGTIACVKHLAVNNQEKDRYKVNVNVDERTLREIYLYGFEAAIKEAGALTIMGGYNKFRGEYCCHNDYLLNEILKKEWGFKGAVISDWGGTHNTIEAATKGLDIEMGTNAEFDKFFMATPLLDEVKKGNVSESLINDKVKRILYVILKNEKLRKVQNGELNSIRNQKAALDIAKEGIVLLKNESNFFPINSNKIKSIAVIGENAIRKQAYGGGSSMIKTPFEITPLEGLQKKYGKDIKINFALGYSSETKDTTDYLPLAIEAAKNSDIVLFIGGLNHNEGYDNEGWDKKDLALPYNQDKIINELLKINPKTAVILVCGSPVDVTSWIEKTPAVIQAWYNGMHSGTALASIISGESNPSGKLPFTFPEKLSDSPEQVVGDYPGKDFEQTYNEGVLVGYRWYDTKNIEPQFCFGHGLSYSKFDYKNPKVEVKNINGKTFITASISVKNVSNIEGKEIVQLYLKDSESSVIRPEKELKAFEKINLKPNQEKVVKFLLNEKDLSFYCVNKKDWKLENGEFEVLIGSSARKIKANKKIKI